MRLVEAGAVELTDTVQRHLPEFVGTDRDRVQIRDLLAHTSGLPDQLPENQELRKAHAPLAEFVRRAMTTPLLYPPGAGFGYQSMGILLASEIVERQTGKPIGRILWNEFFEPLGMVDTELGLTRRRTDETAFVQGKFYIDRDADDDHCGMNSDYWRAIGCPWGGVPYGQKSPPRVNIVGNRPLSMVGAADFGRRPGGSVVDKSERMPSGLDFGAHG